MRRRRRRGWRRRRRAADPNRALPVRGIVVCGSKPGKKYLLDSAGSVIRFAANGTMGVGIVDAWDATMNMHVPPSTSRQESADTKRYLNVPGALR